MVYCTIETCQRESKAKGLCMMHYMQARAKGNVTPYRRIDTTYEQRFWNNTSLTDYCWNWVGYTMNTKYGMFSVNGKHTLAHRYSYEYFIGDIANNMVIDHLCKNKACVNPYHLEMVTQTENMRRYYDNEDYYEELI